ncbi:MAG: CHASE2 domain-containing protein [Coleofasciculus sp. A1-SPW-01]|uniref:CHASE2 domain-containing protein n=1 Tax=Coleofasciculus sp. A1-SPW-01 TaxID=3070819 RepID=UPI0032FE018E
MNLCTVFQLNVLRIGQDCSFQLTCGERPPILAKLKYPGELDDLYRNWRASYERSYGVPLRAEIQDDFSFTPKQVDWKNRSEEAKAALLENFYQWLGSVELLPIRDEIQSVTFNKLSDKKLWKGNNNCVDLLIACDSPDLARLPWEMWEIAPKDLVHISRTAINAGNKVIEAGTIPQRGKPRILAILADATELDLNKDKQAVRLLKKVATVDEVKLESEDIKKDFIERLLDDRGWDALIFAGHSNETALTGGKLELAPGVTLSISEIEDQLTEAKNRGLRVAIFNSCNGICIAESLIRLGLSQVVVMREKIHDTAAHQFLHKLCQGLAEYKDIQTAIWETCEYFETEKYAYPSAYLIPSLFRHPSLQADLFQIEPLGLKRFWRTWKPTKREAIALSAALVLSFLVPVQDLLLDVRQLSQAVYRDLTNQLPQGTPPVRLIAIDQESINEAITTLKDFKIMPMDRRYLAQLINRLSQLNIKTIGINYGLHTQEPNEQDLASSIKMAIETKDIWFVFAVDEAKKKDVVPTIAKSEWSFQGDTALLSWDVMLPKDPTCAKSCPFAYSLALSYLLNQNHSLADLPQPQEILKSSTDAQKLNSFQERVSKFLNHERNQDSAIASLERAFAPFGLHSIIDFSIPPQQVYERESAKEFIGSGLPDPNSELQKRIEKQVAIITSGGYEEAQDRYSVPLAIGYWCYFQNQPQEKKVNCPDVFTAGEAHAYMVYQLLSQHRVIWIPNFWMILLAALLGKGMALMLLKQERKQRQRSLVMLVWTTPFYEIIGLQIYISALVSIPLFFPSLVFLVYILPIFRRNRHA